jgi:fructose-1,6-bisphosphatase/inositol monophosphatase family enzyme
MKLPTEKELRDTSIEVIQNVLRAGQNAASGGPFGNYANKVVPEWKDPTNRTRFLDEIGRTFFLEALTNQFGDRIKIFGEEEKDKPGKDFLQINKVVAFIDPVDGTDLAVRGFSNWVSTVIFVIPKQRKIISSVVGHSSGDIYYANEHGAYVRPRRAGGKKNHDTRLRCDSEKVISLCDAAICYYGQKPKNLLEMAKHKGFLTKMEEFKIRMSDEKNAAGKTVKKKEGLDIRIYNLAGNPMIVKIPSGAVDAVFSIRGAHVYDVMPAAYIAVKAGAFFSDPTGKPVDLFAPFLTANGPFPYIISGSKSLSKELAEVLSKP